MASLCPIIVCLSAGTMAHGLSVTGTYTRSGDLNNFNITCISEEIPEGESAEIRIDDTTEDELRHANGTCYHKGGRCNALTCSCSALKFASIVKVSRSKGNLNISCVMRFPKKDGSLVLKLISISFNGTDFETNEKKQHVVVNNTVPSDNKDKQASSDKLSPGVIFTVVLICTVFLVVLVVIIYNKRRQRNKNGSTHERTGQGEKETLMQNGLPENEKKHEIAANITPPLDNKKEQGDTNGKTGQEKREECILERSKVFVDRKNAQGVTCSFCCGNKTPTKATNGCKSKLDKNAQNGSTSISEDPTSVL